MKDMTTGSIPRHMLHFTLPLLIGNVFQQLYNAVDTVIVGRLLGKDALAAVGSAGAVMNVLLFLIVGICLGASILIAHFYGAQDYEILRKETGTALTGGILFTVFISIISLCLSKQILRAIHTPDEIILLSAQYLNVIIIGLLSAFLFNFFSSAMRALGIIKAPIIFLFISSVLNAALDIVFIKYLETGVRGAALATVVSQIVSAALCFLYIRAKVPLLTLSADELKINPALLRRTVEYSGTYAIQQSFLHIGVLFVQGAVNLLGINSIAAYNAVTKVDGFALLPGDSLASSLSTFTAQNNGAGKKDRIVSGMKYTVVMGLIYCGLLTLFMSLRAESVVSLFVSASNTEVISIGSSYLRLMSILYILTVFCNSFQGFFRGLGRMRVTLFATVIQIPIRVFLSYFLLNQLGLNAIPVATGIGWVCMVAYESYLYRKYQREVQPEIASKE